MIRFLLLLISWLLSTTAAVLVTYIVRACTIEFWGKPMMEIIRGSKKDKEDEDID